MRAHAIVAAAICFFTLSAIAQQSQPPTPTPPKASEPPKAKAASGKQDAKSEQRGTKSAPLFVEGHVTTVKSQADTERDAQEGDDKTSRERWTLVATGLTAVFTLAMAVIGGFQLFMFKRQLRFIDNQFKLARREYLANHLPKLVVRRAVIHDKPTRIAYAITNVGEAQAIVTQSNVTVYVTNKGTKLGARPPFSEETNSLGNLRIGVRDTVVREITSPDLTEQVAVINRQPHYDVMFFGWILYRTVGGNRRYTAFCRIYDPAIEGFRKLSQIDEQSIPDHDRYEYID